MQEIGSVPHKKHAPQTKQESEYLTKGKAIFEELNDFGPPIKGARAERISVFMQAARVSGKSGEFEQEAIEAFKLNYTHTEIPSVFKDFDSGKRDRIEITMSELRVIFRDIDRNSAPGFPLDSLSKANGELLDKYAQLILTVVNKRLNALYLYYDTLLCSDSSYEDNVEPRTLVELGLVDAMRVFVKGEAHSIQKIAEGRLRIIFSVGLIDNIVARVIGSKGKKQEISDSAYICSKPGMGLHDEGLQTISSYIRSMAYSEPDKVKELYSLDVKGWDWSMTWTDFKFDFERRKALTIGSEESCWSKVLYSHMYCMARKVLIFSDGSMVQQLVPGVMPSGWYWTSDTNSGVNVGIAFSAIYKEDQVPFKRKKYDSYKCAANGDDIIVSGLSSEIWTKHYSDFGKTMSLCEKVTSFNFEFCSTQFMENGFGYPVRIGKALYNLLSNKPTNVGKVFELYEGFRFNVRHHPNRDYFDEVVRATGFLKLLDLERASETENSKPDDVTALSEHVVYSYNDPKSLRSAKQNAERLHGISISNNRCESMYSPSPVRRITYMTRKQKQSNKKPVAQRKQPKAKKPTPFRDVGGVLGNAVGSMFGSSHIGKSVGKWLGTGIGGIFGSGDYTLTNENKYNVLTNANQIPKFDTTKQTNVVCHREYLGDITGATAFNNRGFPINPGLSQTFPWLSTIAQNYQEYKIHGMVFEFRPLITDFIASGSPGVVVMATNYNSNDALYTSRQQIENVEFATSTKPTVGLLHGIECAATYTANPIKYVRTGSVGTEDLRLYDQGNFQFVSQNNPTIDLGELWVSYCIEFFKPTITEDLGGSVKSLHLFRTGVSGTTPFGTTTVINSGNFQGVSISGTILAFQAQPQQQYLINVVWKGTPGFAWTAPSFGFTGLAFRSYYQLDTTNTAITPASGDTSTDYSKSAIVNCTLLSEGIVTFTLGSGLFPLTTSVDVFITELSSTVSA